MPFLYLAKCQIHTTVWNISLKERFHNKSRNFPKNYLVVCIYIYIYITKLTRERNVLFNDALNTLYLRLYGVRHMVKDHSDSEKGNPLPPHRLLLMISSKGSFICTITHRQDYTYHGLCYTGRGALAGARNSSMAKINKYGENVGHL